MSMFVECIYFFLQKLFVLMKNVVGECQTILPLKSSGQEDF